MQKIKNFFQNSKIVTKINAFLGNWYYVAAVAALYFACWCFKFLSSDVSFLVNMILNCVVLIFGLVFSKDVKFIYPPLIYFMMSVPELPAMGALAWPLIVSAGVCAFTLVAFAVKQLLFLGGLRFGVGPINITLFILCVLMSISYGINVASGEFLPQYVGGGAALLVILIGMFLISVVSFICNGTGNDTYKRDYLFYIFIIAAFVMIIQFVVLVIAQSAAGVPFDYYLNAIGWGNRNTFGKLGCICLLFIYFKLIKNPKKYWPMLFIYIALFMMISMANSRGALGFSVVLTIVLMIEALVRFKKHYLYVLLIYACCIVFILVLFASIPQFKGFFSRFFEEQYELNGRDVIWIQIINDTFTTPIRIIFGGSTPYLFELSPTLNVYHGNTFLLAHSTLFTYLATLGIVGVLLFIAHSGMQVWQTFKYFKQDERLILLIMVILGITYGIIDNTSFEFVFSLPLILIMAVGEKKNQRLLIVGDKKLQVTK